MSPLFETILGPLVFVLIFQPFYLLQILPFWNFLEPDWSGPVFFLPFPGPTGPAAISSGFPSSC